jgi:uncharacterized membrane protein required for colicin V production
LQTPVIIDIAIAAILLGFLIYGCRRGFFRSIAGIIIIIVALVGAGYFANMLMPVVSTHVQPFIEKRVEARVNKLLGSEGSEKTQSQQKTQNSGTVQMPEEDVPSDSQDSSESQSTESSALSAEKLLNLLKIDRDTSSSVLQSATEKMRESGISAMTAVEESLAETILHALLFLLLFFVLLALLKLVMHAVDRVLTLPGLHFLNHLGGAIFGLVEGALILFLGIWVLRRVGVALDSSMVEKTILLRFFTTYTPLSVLSFL